MKYFFLLMLCSTALFAQQKKASTPAQTPTKTQVVQGNIDQYLGYLTGDFDNKAQVEAEVKAGKQVHPYAKHITRVIDKRVKNALPNFGTFVLEESYYKYPDKDTIVKPYLFLFVQNARGEVILHSLKIPSKIDKTTLRNSNPNWSIEFSDVQLSETFQPAPYKKTEKGFYIKAENSLPDNMKFTLEETIGKEGLEVMETLEKDGKSQTPYTTPIQYKRLLK